MAVVPVLPVLITNNDFWDFDEVQKVPDFFC